MSALAAVVGSGGAPRVPGLTGEEQDVLGRLVARLEACRGSNLLRQRLYDNKHLHSGEWRHHPGLPRHLFRMGVTLGWTGKAVDTLARRCTLDGFTWPDGELDSLGAREVWDGNNLASEINSAKVSSLIHGTAFLVVTRGTVPGEPSALIHVVDALSGSGEWDPRSRGLRNFVNVISWGDEHKVTEFTLFMPGVTVYAVKSGRSWSVERSRHIFGVPAEPLVYKPRVGRPMGSSRITKPIISLQAQAVVAMCRLEGHMDTYSFPDWWLLGAEAGSVKGADGSNVAAMATALGRVRGIPDIAASDSGARDNNLDRADIKQFPASNPTPHLANLNALAKMFAREASLPDSAVAITDMANPTSGESYDASQYELIAEAEGAMLDWSLPIKRTFLKALQMRNSASDVPSGWQSLAPNWRDPRYTSKAAKADAGLKQIQAVPALADSEVGLELLGLDAQQIRRVMADRRRVSGSAALAAVAERLAGDDAQA